MSSTSCCAGKCGCGSSCKCGSSCGGCKMKPDISNSETTTVTGVAPTKSSCDGSERGAAASENHGCKCGPSCTCNPCMHLQMNGATS